MTNVAYPDLEERSPDGRYLLEARSPSKSAYFQGDFRYRLLLGEKVLWERPQARRESSPRNLAVSDEGYVVIQTHLHMLPGEIIAMGPDGRELVRVGVLKGSGEVWDPGCQGHSTAGYPWTGGSLPYFFAYQGRAHFGWRTRTGNRLVLSLEPPVGVQEPTPELEAACRRAEDLVVDQRLPLGTARLKELPASARTRKDRLAVRRVRAGVAGALAVLLAHPRADCVPTLRKLEQSDRLMFLSVNCRGLGLGSGWGHGPAGFRPVVQQILRKLGEAPLAPAYHFATGLRGPRMKLAAPADRSQRLHQLTPDLDGRAVLLSVGCPDYVGSEPFLERWEYDIQGSSGWTTLTLEWGSGPKLEIQPEAPARWETRDPQLLNSFVFME